MHFLEEKKFRPLLHLPMFLSKFVSDNVKSACLREFCLALHRSLTNCLSVIQCTPGVEPWWASG